MILGITRCWDELTLPGGVGESSLAKPSSFLLKMDNFRLHVISRAYRVGLTVHYYQGVSTNYDRDCSYVKGVYH